MGKRKLSAAARRVLLVKGDRGAVGLAQAARKVSYYVPEGRARGSVASARTQVVRYADTTLYDRLYARGQISEPQYLAAEQLARMWTAAGLDPAVSAVIGYPVRDEGLEAESRDLVVDPEAPTARDKYRRLMRRLPAAYVLRLEAMLSGQHPGVGGLETLQEALSFLAKLWKIGIPA